MPYARHADDDSTRSRLRWSAPLWVAVVVLPLLAILAVHGEFERQHERAQERLQALADLRDSQVEGWIQRQLSLAAFLAASDLLAQIGRAHV